MEERRRSIPNEPVMEKAEEIVRLLQDQLGKPIHGIVISVIVQEPSEEHLYVYPVTLGRWRSGVATFEVFSRWTASFSDYIFRRLINKE